MAAPPCEIAGAVIAANPPDFIVLLVFSFAIHITVGPAAVMYFFGKQSLPAAPERRA